jgi:ornithine carbamoyltransferase
MNAYELAQRLAKHTGGNIYGAIADVNTRIASNGIVETDAWISARESGERIAWVDRAT